MSYLPGAVGMSKLVARAVITADSSLILPANTFIQQILAINNTANAVTGGLKFGSIAGGVDIVAALAVGANAIAPVLGTGLLKNLFSVSATQTLFIDAVVAWNSASVDIIVVYGQL